MAFDVYLFQLVNNLTLSWPWFGLVGKLAAGPLIWLMAAWYVGAIIYLGRNWFKQILLVGLGGAALYLSNIVTSLIWFRPRPFVSLAVNLLIDASPASKSFPSDHSSLAFFLAWLLVSLNRSWWWAFLVAALVALGRVIVGVHYPLDVLAGAAMGMIFGYLTNKLETRFSPGSKIRQQL